MRTHLLAKKKFLIGGSIAIIGIAAVIAGDVIVPGDGNTATGTRAVVVSGFVNTASGSQSAVVGGRYNEATDTDSGVLTGYRNSVLNYRSGIVAGGYNDISGYESAIASGNTNEVSGDRSFIGAGIYNEVSGTRSAISSGHSNVITGDRSFIGAGIYNTVGSNAFESSILAGRGNFNDGFRSSVIAGHNNTILGGNSVASGFLTTVEGNLTFAHAREITVAGDGVTVFSDNDPYNERVASDTLTDSWTMYGIFENGYQFFTDSGMTTGAQLVGGATAWSAMSDRNAKREFEEVDTVEVLKKVAAMPMTTWSYKHDDKQTRYMGVMAQDLHQAFGLGHDDKTINTLVADGVAMAAIQGLNTLLEEKDTEIEELKSELGRLKTLEDKITAIEAAIGSR